MDLKTVVLGEINLFFPFLLLIPLIVFIFKHLSPKFPPLPPGPHPLPIVGNMFQLGKKFHVSLTTLAEVHGPLMSLRLGTQLLIVASSPAAAKEILKTHDRILSGRYISYVHPAKYPKLNYMTVAFSYECNDQWKYLRSIFQTELFSNNALKSQVKLRKKKVVEMVEFLGSKEGQVVRVGEIVYTTTLNILSNIVFSMDFVDFEGKGVGGKWRELTKKIVELGTAPNVPDFYPILSGLDVQGLKRMATQIRKRIFAIWEDILKERRKQGSDVSSRRDFLDIALLEIGLSDDQINPLMMELLSAGTDTNSLTIEWVMAELLRNQEAMHKLRDELTHNIGKDMVIESHLPHLPYLQACVKEALRLYPPGTFILPHRALETCEVMGYSFPKDSKVIVNLWAIGRDPTIWDDPLSFKPERFLNSGLDFKGNDFEFIPFSAGRRICPGLPLATRQIPLIIASLVHLFDWVLPSNIDPAELNMNEKLVLNLEMERRLHLIPKVRK